MVGWCWCKCWAISMMMFSLVTIHQPFIWLNQATTADRRKILTLLFSDILTCFNCRLTDKYWSIIVMETRINLVTIQLTIFQWWWNIHHNPALAFKVEKIVQSVWLSLFPSFFVLCVVEGEVESNEMMSWSIV